MGRKKWERKKYGRIKKASQSTENLVMLDAITSSLQRLVLLEAIESILGMVGRVSNTLVSVLDCHPI
jgi:hypothetical protein